MNSPTSGTTRMKTSQNNLPTNALCVPTAIYAFPGGAASAWQLISGRAASPLCELGWKSLGVLELTALPSIDKDHWVPVVQETDALLVGGGDPLYLCYWIHQSGLSDLFRHCAKRCGWE